VNGTTEAPLLVSAIPGGGHEMAKGKPMVKHAAAGEDFALVVTENGLLYSWGSGAFGQVRAHALSSRCHITRPHPHECARVHAGECSWASGIRAIVPSWCRWPSRRRVAAEA
jgi:alpha-tubulin suppressor-like RCC1 family protein